MRMRLGTIAVAVLFVVSVSAGPAAGQVAETFTVTVESQSPAHPYYQEGFPSKFAVDGTQGKELILEKGQEYAFQMNGVSSLHPFYLSTSAVGAGESPFDDGVEGNRATGNETLTFTPPAEAPDSLWYQCLNHTRMGWRMALVEDSARATVSADGAVSFESTGVTIGFSGTSGSGPVTVNKFSSVPSNTEGIAESTVSQYRFVLESDEELSFGSGTEIRFDVGTLGGIDAAANVTVYHRPTVGAGAFTALSTTYESDANELVVTSGEGGEFVFASNSEPLPVEFADFEARTDGGRVQLVWQTASEQGNAGFEVQRRRAEAETSTWQRLGFVESKASGGTTTEPQSYRFEDTEPPYEADALAYRLKQVDVDGSAHLSETVTVRRGVDAVELLQTAPNPIRTQLTVRFAVPQSQNVSLRLYDTLGRQVRTLVQGRMDGRSVRQFAVHELSAGVYFLRLTAGDETRTRRITVVR